MYMIWTWYSDFHMTREHKVAWPRGSVPWPWNMLILSRGLLNGARMCCLVFIYSGWHLEIWVELGPLHTRGWEPVTVRLQSNSRWWKRWGRSKFASHYARGADALSEMQDRCKVYVDLILHGIRWIMVTLEYFQNPHLGGRPNTKPGDHGHSKC